jgi:hypothetical protein
MFDDLRDTPEEDPISNAGSSHLRNDSWTTPGHLYDAACYSIHSGSELHIGYGKDLVLIRI